MESAPSRKFIKFWDSQIVFPEDTQMNLVQYSIEIIYLDTNSMNWHKVELQDKLKSYLVQLYMPKPK